LRDPLYDLVKVDPLEARDAISLVGRNLDTFVEARRCPVHYEQAHPRHPSLALGLRDGTGGHQDPAVEATIDVLGRFHESGDHPVDTVVAEVVQLAYVPFVNDVFRKVLTQPIPLAVGEALLDRSGIHSKAFGVRHSGCLQSGCTPSVRTRRSYAGRIRTWHSWQKKLRVLEVATLFYALALVLYGTSQAESVYLAALWVFVVFRGFRSAVATG